jgi:hypothetical protein
MPTVYDFVHIILDILYVTFVAATKTARKFVSVIVKFIAVHVVENGISKNSTGGMTQQPILISATNVPEKVLKLFKQRYGF